MSESNDIVPGKSSVTFHKLEVPFDLDSIFTMQYNVSGLKAVLEFILEHLGELKQSSMDTLASL
jgi:phenylalanine-4-hydroxylase